MLSVIFALMLSLPSGDPETLAAVQGCSLYGLEVQTCTERHSGLPSREPCTVTLHEIVPPSNARDTAGSTAEGRLERIWQYKFRFIDRILSCPDGSALAIAGRLLEGQDESDGVLIIFTAHPNKPVFRRTTVLTGLGYFKADGQFFLVMGRWVSEEDKKVLWHGLSLATLEEREFPELVHSMVFMDWKYVKFVQGKMMFGVYQTAMRDCHPPADMLDGREDRWNLYENDDYLYLLNMSRVSEDKGSRVVLRYEIGADEWERLEVKGNRTIGKVVGGEILFRVAWDYPEASSRGACSTGEWLWMRPEMGEVVSLEPANWRFEPDTDILYIGSDYVIARAGHRLVRIDLFEGKYMRGIRQKLFAEPVVRFHAVFKVENSAQNSAQSDKAEQQQ